MATRVDEAAETVRQLSGSTHLQCMCTLLRQLVEAYRDELESAQEGRVAELQSNIRQCRALLAVASGEPYATGAS